MPRVGPAPIDDAAVQSQAEAVATVSLANRAIDKLGLATNPEFDSVEANSRAVDRFLSRLTVIARPGSRVVQIELVSRDPELAARAANAVAEIYLRGRLIALYARLLRRQRPRLDLAPRGAFGVKSMDAGRTRFDSTGQGPSTLAQLDHDMQIQIVHFEC